MYNRFPKFNDFIIPILSDIESNLPYFQKLKTVVGLFPYESIDINRDDSYKNLYSLITFLDLDWTPEELRFISRKIYYEKGSTQSIDTLCKYIEANLQSLIIDPDTQKLTIEIELLKVRDYELAYGSLSEVVKDLLWFSGDSDIIIDKLNYPVNLVLNTGLNTTIDTVLEVDTEEIKGV